MSHNPQDPRQPNDSNPKTAVYFLVAAVFAVACWSFAGYVLARKFFGG